MTLARANGSLTRPWGLVRTELDNALGGGQDEGDGRCWTADFRLYSLTVTANRSAGDVEIAVSTSLPYTIPAIGALLITVGIIALGAPTYAAFLAFTGCLAIAATALLPTLYHFQKLYHRVPNVIDVDTVRITPSVTFPVCGVLVIMWSIATSPLHQGLVLLLAGLLLGITAYAVGAVPNQLQRQQSVLMFAFFSGLPLLVTTGNYGLISHIHDLLPSSHLLLLVWVLCIHTIVFVGVYTYLCREFVANVSDLSNEPISSRISRIGWFGYVLVFNVATLLLFVGLLSDYRWFDRFGFPTAEVIAAHHVLGVPFPRTATATLMILLALPLIGIVSMWGLHLYQQFRQFNRIRDATTPDTTVESNVPVRILDTDRPLAHVAQLSPARTAVVLSSGLRDELGPEELAAVIVHEEYHVRNRDPLWNLLASMVGVVVGGRNLLVASHDYPRVEREADRYAADRCGTDALVGALRTIERLNMTTTDTQPQFGGEAQRIRLSALFAAPYRVLFGSVVVANAHASVDERVERVLTAGDSTTSR